MNSRTLTIMAFLFGGVLVVVAGCATTKDQLGASYALNRPDTDQTRTVDCGTVRQGGGSLRLGCSAFVSAAPAQVLAIVSNPYFSRAVSAPFLPKVFDGLTYTEAPVRFRYQAQADISESVWSYADASLQNMWGSDDGDYGGRFVVYTGSGVIEVGRWYPETQWGRVTWRLHGHVPGARTDEPVSGLFLEEVEFSVRPERLGDLEGARLSVAFVIHPPPYAYSLHREAADQLRRMAKEVVEAVAAIVRLSSDADVKISRSEREALLPTEFTTWEKEKKQ